MLGIISYLLVIFALGFMVARIVRRIRVAGGLEKFMWQIFNWCGKINEDVDGLARRLSGWTKEDKKDER